VYRVRMTPLSPLDALGPAFRRTREVLAQPFRLGFFLKIALVAALTQPNFYSASISYPVQGAEVAAFPRIGHTPSSGVPHFGSYFLGSSGLAAFGIAAVIAAVLIAFAIWILLAYLYCRLRFTLFDLVVYKRGRVRQAWSRYGSQAWRYFGLVILVSLGFMVIAAIIIGPTLLNLIRLMRPLAAAGQNANPFQALGALLPFLGAVLIVGLMWAIVDAMMQDFLLPPMAIEDAPLENAFGRFFRLLKTDTGPVLLYVLLRFAVGLGLTWILMLVFFLILMVAGLAIFGVGTLLYHALWASVLGQVVCVTLAILVGLVFIAIYAIVMISIYGFAGVFKQSYAAYFFGSRYPELGDLIAPPPVAEVVEPFEPPPSAPPPPPSFPPIGEAPPVW
jgi:hypothetical protein